MNDEGEINLKKEEILKRRDAITIASSGVNADGEGEEVEGREREG